MCNAKEERVWIRLWETFALAFLELTVLTFCQHLGYLGWKKMQLCKWGVVWDCIMVCEMCCETVEAVIMEWTIHFSYRSAVPRGFSTERIIIRRYCAFRSLTTELYTEFLCFSSNVWDSLKLSLTSHFISLFLGISYFIHRLCTPVRKFVKIMLMKLWIKKYSLFSGVLFLI